MQRNWSHNNKIASHLIQFQLESSNEADEDKNLYLGQCF